MSYNFLFKKAGRVLMSYLNSVSNGETAEAERNKKVYEDYFRTHTYHSQTGQKRNSENYNDESFNNEREKRSDKIKDEKQYYFVLGLSQGASIPEIKTSYKKLIAQYHPDKVENLGPELKDLAKKKTQELNEAYQFFKKKLNF
jgi:hypothetical protein